MDKKLRIRKYSLLGTLAMISLSVTASCKSNQKQTAETNETSVASLTLTGELAKKESIWAAAAQQALNTFNTNKKVGSVAFALITSGTPVNSGQTLVILDEDTCDIYKVASSIQTFPEKTNRFKKTTTHKKGDASFTKCTELSKRPTLTAKQDKFFGGVKYELHYFTNNEQLFHEFFGPFYIASTKNLDADQQTIVDYIAKIIGL